jgi:hypothetical protein
MGDIFKQILQLVKEGDVRVSDHGYDELAADGLFVRDILSSVENAVEVEEYPDYPKGPCILVLQENRSADPIHVVWGIPKDKSSPAVLVTAYRPDQDRWEQGFLRRKK